jgi:hypothetical protein
MPSPPDTNEQGRHERAVQDGVDLTAREDYIPARRRGRRVLLFCGGLDRLLDLRPVRRFPKQVNPVPCLAQGVGWFVRCLKCSEARKGYVGGVLSVFLREWRDGLAVGWLVWDFVLGLSVGCLGRFAGVSF